MSLLDKVIIICIVLAAIWVIHNMINVFLTMRTTRTSTEQHIVIADLSVEALSNGGVARVISRRITYFDNIYYLPYYGKLTVKTTNDGWEFYHPAFRKGKLSAHALSAHMSLNFYGYALQKEAEAE